MRFGILLLDSRNEKIFILIFEYQIMSLNNLLYLMNYIIRGRIKAGIRKKF